MRKALAVGAGLLWFLASQAAVAAAPASGPERMIIVSRDGQPTRVVASGAITAAGTVADNVVLDPVAGTFTNHAVMTFAAGTLSFEDAGSAQLTVDPRDCVGKGHFVAPFRITAGTGAYANVSGDGTVVGDIAFIFDHTAGGCAQVASESWGIARATGAIDGS